MNKALPILCLIYALSLGLRADDQVPAARYARLNALCADPASPVKYDKTTHLYSVSYDKMVNGQRIACSYPLYFDPFSGAPLPTDHDLFYDVDQTLFKKVSTKLNGVKTLAAVRKILGKPDLAYGENQAITGELIYNSMSDTTSVIVQKPLQADVLEVYVIGKPKTK